MAQCLHAGNYPLAPADLIGKMTPELGLLKTEIDPLKLVFYTFRGPKDPFSFAPSANPGFQNYGSSCPQDGAVFTAYYLILYCVSQKEQVWRNQQPYLKMCPPYLQFCFWFNMSTTLGQSCVKNLLWINQMVLKSCLWTWTQRKLRI